VFCESNTLAATIQHVVTLGVYCTDLPPDNPYFFDDLYFECTESTAQFVVLTDDKLFNSTFNRHGCTASAEFASGSTSSNPQILSSVAITTDDYWLSRMDQGCFTRYVSAAPVLMTNAPVTPSPTVVMNTTGPSLFPTLSPVDAPIRPSTNPPAVAVEAPTQPREATPTLTVQSSDSSNNNDSGKVIGGVVGGIVAGIAIMSLVGFFVFRRLTDPSNHPKPEVGGSVAPSSLAEGTVGNDNLLGPAPTPPMHPLSPTLIPPQEPMAVVLRPMATAVPIVPSTTNNYAVDYKDQARTVLQEVPFAAVALDVSATSAGSQKTTQS
jgi:hypothetical protein